MKISQENVKFGRSADEPAKLQADVDKRPRLNRGVTTILFLSLLAFFLFSAPSIKSPSQALDSRTLGLSTETIPKRQTNPSRPGATAVHARGLNAAPGAIVCHDYATVMLVFRLYTTSWTERMQDSLTQGQSRLIRGESAVAPDPALYGCLLVRPDTLMYLDPGNAVPVVTVQLENGKFFKGVTMQPMIAIEGSRR